MDDWNLPAFLLVLATALYGYSKDDKFALTDEIVLAAAWEIMGFLECFGRKKISEWMHGEGNSHSTARL